MRLICTDKTRTVQAAKKECDINQIMSNWKRTGVISHGQSRIPQYEDLTGVPIDYHTSMNELLAADEAFMALPAAVRKAFGNDPGQLLDKFEEPATQKILGDAGLLNPKKETKDDAPPTVPDPQPGPTPETAVTAVPDAT